MVGTGCILKVALTRISCRVRCGGCDTAEGATGASNDFGLLGAGRMGLPLPQGEEGRRL